MSYELTEVIDKLRERGEIPIGLLYYRPAKDGRDILRLAVVGGLTAQEASDLLEKFDINFQLNGK